MSAHNRNFYNILLTVLFTSFVGSLHAQEGFREVCDLASKFNEISGIEFRSSNSFYAINDGGNPSEVYALDTTGQVLETYSINASNTDWEDLASSSDKLFVGDFGNNSNNRKDLKILILEKDKLVVGQTISSEILRFNYEDQKSFPPQASNLKFDCEAFAYHNDSLYLFTKDRSSPYKGWCKMYVLPAKAGTYTAKLLDSVSFPQLRKELSWITAADISQNQLVLLSSSDARVFDLSAGMNFRGASKHLLFGHFSQKESLTIADSNRWWVADEKFSGLGGPRLFEYSWNGVLKVQAGNRRGLSMWQSGQFMNFDAQNEMLQRIEIYSLQGRLESKNDFAKNQAHFRLDLSHIKNGSYFAIIYDRNGFKHIEKFIWLSDRN